MRPSEVLEQTRKAIREATKRFNAVNPPVFGSVARGSDLPERIRCQVSQEAGPI